jgi:hypothetical protein
MAAGAQRQYTAIFAIGAKLLGSFRGVMSTAHARMKSLNDSARKFAGGFIKMAGKLVGVLGIFASFAAGHIFSSIFEDAGKEAAEADQRSRKLAVLLLSHNTIRKKGIGFAQEQTRMIFEANEALAQQGVIGKELLDASSTQLAIYGYSPKAIADMAGPMADVLAMSKGVNASQEDAVGLSDAWGRAVKTGMTKGMKQFGFVLSDTEQKQFKGLKNAEARNAWILKWAQNYKGFNAELAKTDAGKIQLFHNSMRQFALDIGKEVLPAQAQMANAWRELLPEIKPLAIGVFKVVLSGATALAGYIHTTLLPAFRQFMVFLKGPLAAAWAPVKQAFWDMIDKVGPAFAKMFGGLGDTGKTFSETMGDTVIKLLGKLGDLFKWIGDNADWLVPLVTKVAIAFGAISIALEILSPLIAVFNLLMLAGPWGWIALAIGAVIAGIVLLYTHWGTLNNMLAAFWEWVQKIPVIGPILTAVWADIQNRWNELTTLFADAWPLIKAAAIATGQAILEAFMKPIEEIKKGWNELKTIWESRPPWLGGGNKTYSPAETAARAGVAQYGAKATGGIIQRAGMALVGEAGPEAIIPLSGGGQRAEGLLSYANRAMGRSSVTASRQTNVTFAPQITINGNATAENQRAMTTSLRRQAKEFITQFKAAQNQERRLSYESGYA